MASANSAQREVSSLSGMRENVLETTMRHVPRKLAKSASSMAASIAWLRLNCDDANNCPTTAPSAALYFSMACLATSSEWPSAMFSMMSRRASQISRQAMKPSRDAWPKV